MIAVSPRRALSLLAVATSLAACVDPSGPFERGTRILYTAPAACPSQPSSFACSGVYSIDPDGGAPIRAAQFDHLSQPAWTLDGTRVAFRWYDASRDFYVARAVTVGSTDTVTVASPSFNYDDLTWSPDGSRLAYHHWDQLCVGPTSGASERCWGAWGDRWYRAIGFTHDGASLVVRSDSMPAGGSWTHEGLFLLNLASGNRTKLAVDTRRIFSAAVSPATPMLAIGTDSVVEQGGEYLLTLRIYVASMPNGQPRRLTRITDLYQQSGETRPRWSPDGRRIAFALGRAVPYSSTAPETTDLYVVNADGSGLRRLTSTGWVTPLAWLR